MHALHIAFQKIILKCEKDIKPEKQKDVKREDHKE